MSWWSIMDYGQYWKNGAAPMGYSAYEKNFMGWLKIDTLKTEKQVVRINALGSGNENAYYILNDNDASGSEYYILENRQPSVWYPERLGSGMFVTHVDYNAAVWANNTVNTVKDHRRMSFVPADNSIKSESQSTPADYQGDLFPGLAENRELFGEVLRKEHMNSNTRAKAWANISPAFPTQTAWSRLCIWQRAFSKRRKT